ncbi:MAG: phosphoribosylanthranilate isomerase [Bacteroidetes bacterium]|nr:phosphoribosylanthranilate isomerase [Bacteroidota bacterium]
MTKVKICGITTLADARFASGAGADFLGFIQVPNSPRYIAPDLARDIINWVYGSQAVGVFAGEDAERVNEICDQAGFTYAQLHGNETAAYCEWIDRPIIKAIRIAPTDSAAAIQQQIDSFEAVVEYFLFDSMGNTSTNPADFGGTGRTFDWSLLNQLVIPRPFFLAGGLSVENAKQAILETAPFALDVSSGVEESKGVKDFAKIDAFMKQVRGGVQHG